MKVRLHGTRAETTAAARLLGEVFHVVSISDPYPDRRPSQLVRVYVEVRFSPATVPADQPTPPARHPRHAGRAERRPR